MAEVGFSLASVIALIELLFCFRLRKQELDDQELEVLSISHRPPNYYARTIALRIARLYARKKGRKPTFGTSRDGGHPSTDFGRAVEKCFLVLGIDADFRSPTEWALSQLTEEDFQTPSDDFRGGLFADISSKPAPRKGIAGIYDILNKGPQE